MTKSARDLNEAFRSGSTTPLAVTEDLLRRIGELNPKFNCFITVLAESAIASARASTERFATGISKGLFDGVPIAVKDIIYIEGVRCTAGSKILSSNVAPYDAPVVRRLKEAGAVILGTTNLHEFAAGVTSNNPHFGPVRNPWDPGRVAGGSSGGSAVAVSLGLAVSALGTDTAGSVRIPASLCGVIGLKPTYGRVSRLGVIPLAPSFDTVGILSRTVWEAAATLHMIAGAGSEDLTAVQTEVPDYLGGLEGPPGKVRVGVPRGYFAEGISPPLMKVFDRFIERLSQIGCETAESDLEPARDAARRFFPIRRGEATAFHAEWLKNTPELYGQDVRTLFELGKSVTAVDYINAVNARPALIDAFSISMKGLDLIAVPCTSVAAPAVGQDTVSVSGVEVDVYTALNRLTLPFNVVGFPSLSIPAGFVDGLPVGAQLISRPFEELTILRLGAKYEETFGPFPQPGPGPSPSPPTL